jgi:hypothetical protein
MKSGIAKEGSHAFRPKIRQRESNLERTSLEVILLICLYLVRLLKRFLRNSNQHFNPVSDPGLLNYKGGAGGVARICETFLIHYAMTNAKIRQSSASESSMRSRMNVQYGDEPG